MDPLLQELLDGYHGDTREISFDFPMTQENLVLVLNYGAIEPLLLGFCQRNPECRLAMATFPCLMKRFRYPAVTSMAFPGGAVVWVGGKNFPTTLYTALLHYIALQEYRREFQPSYPADKLVFGSPQQANLVFKVELPPGPYNLAEFKARVTGVKYNPEKFPGARLVIYDEYDYPLTTTVSFEYGTANFMGCKSPIDARKAMKILYEKLSPFVCKPRLDSIDIVHQRKKELEEALKRAHDENTALEKGGIGNLLSFDNINEEGFFEALLNGDDGFNIIIK